MGLWLEASVLGADNHNPIFCVRLRLPRSNRLHTDHKGQKHPFTLFSLLSSLSTHQARITFFHTSNC